MGSSQTLVAAGLRTAPRSGWRTGVGTAVALVAARPSLWLVGGLGFACRGGIFLLALPMVVVPTPIEVRLLLGDALGSTGLAPQFYAALVPLIALGVAVTVVALALVAQAELSLFERFVADAETAEQRDGREPATLTPAGRRRALISLFAIQVISLVALGLASIPVALAVGESTIQQLLRPSPGGATLYARVVAGVVGPLSVLVAALVIVDAFSATASRRLLVSAFGLDVPRGHGRGARLRSIVGVFAGPVRHPLSVAGTSILAWACSVGALLPAVWALSVAADATRGTFLSPRAADPELLPTMVVMTLVFVAVWLAVVLLAGFVSAVRAAVWTAQAIR